MPMSWQRSAQLSSTPCSWQGPVYEISAISAEGTTRLCQDMMLYLERCRDAELEDPERLEVERLAQQSMQREARARVEALRARRRSDTADDGDDDDDDDYDVEVEYAP
jgi:GTP-binding protein